MEDSSVQRLVHTARKQQGNNDAPEDQEACALQVRGSREEVTIEGIVDTGFDGFLCLPTSIAVLLRLELIYATSSELADGTVIEDELVFAGQAEWDRALRHIEMTLTHAEDTLIGTAFLTGYRVELDYSARTVSIEQVS